MSIPAQFTDFPKIDSTLTDCFSQVTHNPPVERLIIRIGPLNPSSGRRASLLTLPNRQSDVHGKRPDFSLVLPLYNPGERLRDSLAHLCDFARNASERWELIFVSDGSTDGSTERVQDWANDRDDAHLIAYTPNRGKGYAVRQGLLAATAPYRIFTDIDLAYPFADICRVAWQLRAGHEAVIGSRTHPDSEIQLPIVALPYALKRNRQSQVFGKLVRTLLPLTQRDTQAGLKGFSERTVNLIVPKMRCKGFGFDCEMLTACVRHGIQITEVPVHVRCDSDGTTTNLRSTLRMVKDLWRIRRQWPAPIVESMILPKREAA